MKITCGTDMIEIQRIKHNIEDTNGKFIDRVYTKQEQAYCESKKAQKYQHYAARFAGKEAALKAVSTLLDNKYTLNWKDIEIINIEQGKPTLNLKNVDTSKIETMDISLAHCRDYAIANVIMILK